MTIALTVKGGTTRLYPQDGDLSWGDEATNWAVDMTTAINQTVSSTDALPVEAILGSAAQVSAGLATHISITAALADVSAGALIYVKPGTYSLDATEVIDKSVTILGAGEGSLFEASASLASGAVLSIDADGVSLLGVKISAGTGTPDYALELKNKARVDVSVKVEGSFAVSEVLNASSSVGYVKNGLIRIGATAKDFTDLSDVPASYATHGSKFVKVKADASGLEFQPETTIDHVNLANIGTNTHAQIDTFISDAGSTYAPLANGVTNGDTHAHNSGDGAQIDHTDLSNIGTNTHGDIDTHISASAAHGVSGNVVGTSDAQVLTNKDIDGGTASNTSRITVPKNTTTNLSGLTRKQGTLLYDTDLNVVKFDDGASLNTLSSVSSATVTSAGIIKDFFASYVGTNPEVGGSTPFQLTTSHKRTQVVNPSGDITIKLPTTSVLAGELWTIVNRSTYIVTVQSSAANTIVTLRNNRASFHALQDTPTADTHWKMLPCAGDSSVVVQNRSGKGSESNNLIRRFTNVFTNVGGGITYASDATYGDSFTINEPGIYSITYCETGTGGFYGVSVNATRTQNIASQVPQANKLFYQSDNANGTWPSVTTILAKNDVIRGHLNGSGNPDSADDLVRFTITQLQKF